MSESREKQIISAVAASWNENAADLIGKPSTLSLLASREVSESGMAAALAVTTTWSSAIAATCSVGGVLICLFKHEDGEELDRLTKQPSDGTPKPGARALVNEVLDGAAKKISSELGESANFAPPIHIDLALDSSRLSSIVADVAHIGTFALSMGDEATRQALILYAPNGSLKSLESTDEQIESTNGSSATEQFTPSGMTAGGPGTAATSSDATPRQNGSSPRNIERLLDVELDVVVRFGITNVALRDVVRMGVGTMIELNRAVEEPVELLVNGRQLARGEVVVVDGYYGVRITEIGTPAERAVSIGKAAH